MKIAVLPVFFNDAPRVTTHTRAQIIAHFDAVKAFYQAQSGGREQLEHHVFEWFRVPISGAQLIALGFQAGDKVVPLFAAGMNVDLSTFKHFVLLLDKSDSRSAAWRPGDPSFRYLHLSALDITPALVAHELGHLAGAGHGNLRTDFRDVEYGDTFCMMGGESDKYTFNDDLGAHGPGMSASMLRACGWLNLEQTGIAVDLGLSSRGGAVVELAPLHGAPPPNAQGRPVVAWSDGLAPGQRLLLEYRTRTGWDRGVPPSGSGPGWIVAHLTAGKGSASSSVLLGSVGANTGATLELPHASATLNVLSVDASRVAVWATAAFAGLTDSLEGLVAAGTSVRRSRAEMA